MPSASVHRSVSFPLAFSRILSLFFSSDFARRQQSARQSGVNNSMKNNETWQALAWYTFTSYIFSSSVVTMYITTPPPQLLYHSIGLHRSFRLSGSPAPLPLLIQVYNIRSCPTPGQFHLFCLPGMNNTLTRRQRNSTVYYQIVVEIKNIYITYTVAYYIIYDEYICTIYACANSDKQGASTFLKMINVLKLFGQINLSRETEINEN